MAGEGQVELVALLENTHILFWTLFLPANLGLGKENEVARRPGMPQSRSFCDSDIAQ
jgi:hypothetical protein